jgi:hypothetical protein
VPVEVMGPSEKPNVKKIKKQLEELSKWDKKAKHYDLHRLRPWARLQVANAWQWSVR